jgi:hypothetical protein
MTISVQFALYLHDAAAVQMPAAKYRSRAFPSRYIDEGYDHVNVITLPAVPARDPRNYN